MSDLSVDLTNVAPVRRKHYRLWLMAIVLFIVALCCMAVTKVVFDWPASPDPVPQQLQWATAGHAGRIGTAYVYDCLGNSIDSKHLWRVEISADVNPTLARKLDLQELSTAAEVPAAFWAQWPYWWRPPRSSPARYLMSPGFEAEERGLDGNFYLMAYDESCGVLYVWYKSNF